MDRWRGIVATHAQDADLPGTLLRKVALPADQPSVLRLVVSGDPFEAPGKSDFALQAGIFDGYKITWFDPKVIDAGTSAAADHWQTLEYPLDSHAGQTVGIVVKVAYGGKEPSLNEEAFFDEISVVGK